MSKWQNDLGLDAALDYLTTIPSQAITSGNPINVGSWKIEIADPS